MLLCPNFLFLGEDWREDFELAGRDEDLHCFGFGDSSCGSDKSSHSSSLESLEVST